MRTTSVTAEAAGAVPDPWHTVDQRRLVLDAWAASPERFREDANAEEDLVLGSYRDRLLVELAQNAADAASAAGVPGRLRITLTDDELRVANTGRPLDAAGVSALSTLRASAKRAAGSVGRFGVGFAAVLTVTDEPAVLSRDGSVCFSAARTGAQVGGLEAVAAEVARRGGAVPVLRLPWPDDRQPVDGFDTEVRLPLRQGARELVDAASAALDPILLLALPELSTVEIVVDGELTRVLGRSDSDSAVLLTDSGARTEWRVARGTGTIPDELLAGRGVEERERRHYTVTWAVPVSGNVPTPAPGTGRVLAPTPTDDELSLPALLIADLPLGPDRRRVLPGPLTEWMVERAAEVYAELVEMLTAGPDRTVMVPRPSITRGDLDAALCAAVLDRLRRATWLPTGAAVCEGSLAAVAGPLAEVRAGVLAAEWSERRYRAALDLLGVQRLGAAEIVEVVSGVDRSPAWWRGLYEALDAGGPRMTDEDALGALPVPLVDGRIVTGVRGSVLVERDLLDVLPAESLRALELRMVHPDATHPLLERLGARHLTPREILADEHTRSLVVASYDAAAPDELADAVLGLVRASGLGPAEMPSLAELTLRTAEGDAAVAGEMLLPGSSLAGVMAADSPFRTVSGELLERWGEPVLAAVGVLGTFAVLRAADAEIGGADTEGHDLDGEQEWSAEAAPGGSGLLDELVAVRDLELVAPERWDDALDLLAVGSLRAAVAADPRCEPTGPDAGGARRIVSYTRWWLARNPVLGGREPRHLRLAGAIDLDGLYDAAPAGDQEWQRLIGVRAGVADLLSVDGLPSWSPALVDAVRDVLARLGDARRQVPVATLRELYARLAAIAAIPELVREIDPPERIRVTGDGVVAAEDAVVVDLPHLLDAVDPAVAVPGPAVLADLLDIALASDEVAGVVQSTADTLRRWSEIPGATLVVERWGCALPETPVGVHVPLRVDDRAVSWWPEVVADHVDGSASVADLGGALGRALAWRCGRWGDRAAAVEAFVFAAQETRLRAEDSWR